MSGHQPGSWGPDIRRAATIAQRFGPLNSEGLLGRQRHLDVPHAGSVAQRHGHVEVNDRVAAGPGGLETQPQAHVYQLVTMAAVTIPTYLQRAE